MTKDAGSYSTKIFSSCHILCVCVCVCVIFLQKQFTNNLAHTFSFLTEEFHQNGQLIEGIGIADLKWKSFRN